MSAVADAPSDASASPQDAARGMNDPFGGDIVRQARWLYSVIVTRAQAVGANKDAFSDPSWAMMLDMLLANQDGRTVSVTSACIAAHAPATTALRHLKLLEDRGWVRRAEDPSDRRRSHVTLTAGGLRIINDCLRGRGTAPQLKGIERSLGELTSLPRV